jgi:hypothetical protein
MNEACAVKPIFILCTQQYRLRDSTLPTLSSSFYNAELVTRSSCECKHRPLRFLGSSHSAAEQEQQYRPFAVVSQYGEPWHWSKLLHHLTAKCW